MMRCHYKQGILIPGCDGAAAAHGCGLSDRQIVDYYCTCERPKGKAQEQHGDPLEKRVAALEKRLAELKKAREV